MSVEEAASAIGASLFKGKETTSIAFAIVFSSTLKMRSSSVRYAKVRLISNYNNH